MGKVVLVTGGVRSGKSSFALEQATKSSFRNKLFIATAEANDDEMKKRIKNHQNERGPEWQTIEAGVRLPEKVSEQKEPASLLIDCLTVWLGSVWYKQGSSDTVLNAAVSTLAQSITKWKDSCDGELHIVTNEVGWGIVPESAEVRQYRDWAGRLNQEIAKISDEVYLVVCGIPSKIKQQSV